MAGYRRTKSTGKNSGYWIQYNKTIVDSRGLVVNLVTALSESEF